MEGHREGARVGTLKGSLGQVAVEREVYRGCSGFLRSIRVERINTTRKLPEERCEEGHEAGAGGEGEGGPGPPEV